MGRAQPGPLSVLMNGVYGQTLYRAGRLQEAAAHIRGVMALDSSFITGQRGATTRQVVEFVRPGERGPEPGQAVSNSLVLSHTPQNRQSATPDDSGIALRVAPPGLEAGLS